MLEWLLNVEPGAVLRGRVILDASWPAFAVLAGAIVLAVAGLRRWAGPSRSRTGWTLVAVRSALLVLLALILLRPLLVVDMEEPRTGEVAVLLDDSLSMRIADQAREGKPVARGTEVERLFLPGRGTVATRLDARFNTRYFRFSDQVRQLGPHERLTFAGASSRMGAALESVAGARPAAIVLVTDGAASDVDPDTSAAGRRAGGVPVHVIGVGADRFDTDVDIVSVRLPAQVLRDDVRDAEVVIAHRGLAGHEVVLSVEVDGAIAWESAVALPEHGDRVVVRPRLAFTEAGPHRVTFRIPPVAGEVLTENNIAHRMVHVRGRPLRVLHFEGEPRFETKFIRRALVGDPSVELVSLVRTAENKFYQLGDAGEAQLPGGLPRDEGTLLRFDVVILGSVGAELLASAQVETLRAFVSRRGGGLLLLGGRQALAEGGHAHSALATLLPVVLEPARADAGYRAHVSVRPTPRGLASPTLRTPAGEALAWERLPPLTVVNPLRKAKPGASVWLEGVDPAGESLIVLASHRYGRGTVATLAVANAWRWQMHADVPLEDRTHEILWRNLVRWLAASAGPPVRLRARSGVVALGESLAIEAERLDETFRPRDGAAEIRVTTPIGDVLALPLEPSWHHVGSYRAAVPGREPGVFEVALDDEAAGTVRTYVLVSEEGEEFHRAELARAALTDLAERTGGRFFSLADAGSVVDAIDDRQGSRIVTRHVGLGDAPVLLLVLLVLAGAEWVLRKRRGLP